MKTEPLVSVIIPAYNNGHFIEFALESIFRQKYELGLLEIIMVDDGSTDDTSRVIKKYLERIIYIYQENKGIASARNRGISVAKGEIITFLDADDEWYEDRIMEVVNKFMERPDICMVYHPVEIIDSNGNVTLKDFYSAFGYKKGLRGLITEEISSGKVFCGGSSFAYRIDVVDRIYPLPEDIKRGVDYYLTVLSSYYGPVEYIPDILGKYRLHSDNVTMMAGQKNYKELALVNRDFAYMREKVIEKITSFKDVEVASMDISIIRRIQAKEMIFCNVMEGKRMDGIKWIPLLFKWAPSLKEIFKGIIVSLMAIFVPLSLYPLLVRAFGQLKRLRVIAL